MDKSGRLEGVIGSLPAEIIRRQPPQFVVDKMDKPLRTVPVAPGGPREDFGCFRSVTRRHTCLSEYIDTRVRGS